MNKIISLPGGTTCTFVTGIRMYVHVLVAVIGCPVVVACTIPSNVPSCIGSFGMRFVVMPGKTRISFDGL